MPPPLTGYWLRRSDQTSEYAPPLVPGIFSAQTVYTFNLDRQLELVSRPDGATLDLVYENNGRLDYEVSPRGTLNLSYHPTTGQLQALTSPESDTVTFGYNGSLLTSEAWGGTVAGSVSRTFNPNLDLSSISVNGANPVTYTYDNDRLLLSAGSLTATREATTGFLDTTTLSTVSDDREYSEFGELSSYAATQGGLPVYSLSFQRDHLGRIEYRTEEIQGVSHTDQYVYDPAGRLDQVIRDSVPTADYDYDENGNRILYNGPFGTFVGTHDDQDRTETFGSFTFTYNENGDLISKVDGSDTTTYSYDVYGNLLSVTLPDASTIAYVVDGRHRRIGKKVDGVLSQGFLYQDGLKIIAELDGAGVVTKRFVYGTKANVPDYMVTSEGTYRIVSDERGSPRLVIHVTTGTVEQRLDYDEFGMVFNDTNPGFQPFGFAGGLYDPDTELVRFGARDYDGETARWTTKDPILFAGGDTNLYGYVLGDPVNWVDPNGLDATVSLYPGASGFGHVGIGINTTNTVGFYPAPGASTLRTLTGRPVRGAMQPDRRAPIDTIVIPTTPAQDQAIQDFINERTQNPGDYDLNDRNCATTVRDALGAGGVNTPETIAPGVLFENLQQQFAPRP